MLNGFTLDSSALRTLQENANGLYSPALQGWKESGGRIVGLLYNYVPEEIVTAAGLLPYRLRAAGSASSALADARFMETNCGLVRHFYDSAARGEFSFLDGLVSTNSCDHERRLYDNWKAVLGLSYGHFLCFPKKAGAEQAERFEGELVQFAESLEAAFGAEITEEKLRAAIGLHNETRRLQRALYELRKLPNPPLSGAEMLSVMMAGTAMPHEEYNALLTQLLADCTDAEGHTGYPLRVFLYGGEIDSVPLLELIESQGALVVGDSLGYGYRSAFADVGDTGDALADLARYMVADRPGEPRVFGTAQSRQDFVRGQMAAFGADAVILPHLPNCDYWGWEKFNFGLYAKANGIPLLDLSVEYVFADSGQMKTRVQAFVETLAEGRQL